MYNSISKMGVYVRVRVYACTSVHVVYGVFRCVCMSMHVLYGVYRCVCVCVCMHVRMYYVLYAGYRVYVLYCVSRFVGSCLATKVFIGNLLAMGRGWVIIK